MSGASGDPASSAPDEERRARLLDERARRLAAPTEARGDAAGTPVMVLRAGRERIGIEAARSTGVVMIDPVMPLPGARPFHLGLGARRGEIFSVVDLAAWLGVGRVEKKEGLCVIVVGRAGRVALRVDAVEEIRQVASLGAARGGAAERAVTLALTVDLVRVIDIDSMLDHPEFSRGRGDAPTRREGPP